MIDAILVAAETDAALGCRWVVVPAVARDTRPMFGLGMEPRQILNLVAVGARRDAR